jgi:sentrin-specific protease 1
MYEGSTPYCYDNVKNWAAKIKATGGNVFKLKYLLIPCNISNSHWCLCFADIAKKRIQYYDSKGGDGFHFMSGLQKYFKDEATKHAGDTSVAHLLDLDSWELIPTDTDTTPQQTNDLDCGVFTCVFAYYLTLQLKLRFTADDMPYFRQRITLDILTKGASL